MTDGENPRLGAYVETSTGGERVRAYVPAPLPPKPPLVLGRFMHVYERAMAAVGRLAGIGVVRETTGRQRGRIYAYSDYLALLDRGADPLPVGNVRKL